MDSRDHLFISYAWEDQAFAKWLALRLTSEGYKVWIDQFELLGGESWPRDIDIAIKTRSFRVLGLLSKHSIAKPNPLKERTLALNIAKQPGMKGFLVPLNVDGLSATEIDWLTSDITFISFAPSWAKGLSQLLKLLEREQCPTFEGDGRAIVSAATTASEVILPTAELLTSNVCEFKSIPDRVATYIVNPQLTTFRRTDAGRDWAFYDISPHRVVAFHAPDDDLSTWLHAELVRSYEWRITPTIEGVTSTHIVIALLRSCIETRCRLRGLIWSAGAKAFYFQGALGATLPVQLPNGEKTTVQHSGQRTYFRIGMPKMPYRYRMAVKAVIERDLVDEFSLVWKLRFHFANTSDVPLPPTQHQSRRKHLTRSWFNRHWLVRHLAVMQFLGDADGLIRVGPAGEQQVVLDCSPLSFFVPKSIDESKLDLLAEIGDEVPIEDDVGIEDHDNDTDNN